MTLKLPLAKEELTQALSEVLSEGENEITVYSLKHVNKGR